MTLLRCKLTIADHNLEVRVARSDEDRAMGLMHRRELPQDEGMLFVCDEAGVQHFWMKDTPLPLSIAYLEDDGTISQIGDLVPLSLEPHCSREPVRYILETNQGWFAARGITAGMRVEGPMFALNAAGG